LNPKAKVGLGLLISAGFLWWAFHGEDLGAIARRLAEADLLWLIAAGAISTSGGVIRAIRWKLLLEPVAPDVSFGARWASLNVGFMVTNVYPARFGEVVRPYALSRIAPVSMSGALGTIVLERALDTVALLAILLVTLLAPGFPQDATVLGRPISLAVTGAVVLCVVILVLLAAMVAFPDRLLAITRSLARTFSPDLEEKVASRLDGFLRGLVVLRDPGTLARAFGWSVVLWLWMAASFWAAFRAFEIELGVVAAVFTQCAVSVFVAIPAAPGFIGTMQAGVAVSVQEIFGVAAEPTLSLALGYHLAGYIPVTLLGLYYASRIGLNVRDAAAAAESEMGEG